MRFAKGHGTENDFIILPDTDGVIDLTSGLAARLCDRRAGLGADGVLRAVRVASGPASAPGAGPAAASGAGAGPAPPGDGAEWFMDYRNADGSPAEMCGNGIRVFARYLLEHDLVAAPELAVATRGGIRLVRTEPDGEITVDMGPPQVLGPGRATLAGRPLEGLRVSLGNPHLACLVDTPLAEFDLSQPPVIDAGQFPDGVNLELVSVIDSGCTSGAAARPDPAVPGRWPRRRPPRWPPAAKRQPPPARSARLPPPPRVAARSLLRRRWAPRRPRRAPGSSTCPGGGCASPWTAGPASCPGPR